MHFSFSIRRWGGLFANFAPAAAFGHGLILRRLSESSEDTLLDKYVPGPVARLGHGLIDHSGLALYGAARLYALHWREWPGDQFINHKNPIATTEQEERYFASMIANLPKPLALAF